MMLRHGFIANGHVSFTKAKIAGTLICENKEAYKIYRNQMSGSH